MSKVKMVIYGVYLDNLQAKLIYETLRVKSINDKALYLPVPDKKNNMKIGLFAEFATDAHNPCYNVDTNHVFGINYASGEEHVFEAMMQTPQRVIDHFQTYAKPFLKDLNIFELPTQMVIEQET